MVAPPGEHVFSSALRGKSVSFTRLLGAWSTITDRRLAEYRAALPIEWSADAGTADRALHYLSELKDRLPAALDEICRVLK